MQAEARAGHLVLLGVGKVAVSVAQSAKPYFRRIVGTTRNRERLDLIAAHGIEPLLLTAESGPCLSELFAGAQLLVSFPPAAESDRQFARLAGAAARLFTSRRLQSMEKLVAGSMRKVLSIPTFLKQLPDLRQRHSGGRRGRSFCVPPPFTDRTTVCT